MFFYLIQFVDSLNWSTHDPLSQDLRLPSQFIISPSRMRSLRSNDRSIESSSAGRAVKYETNQNPFQCQCQVRQFSKIDHLKARNQPSQPLDAFTEACIQREWRILDSQNSCSSQHFPIPLLLKSKNGVVDIRPINDLLTTNRLDLVVRWDSLGARQNNEGT